VKALKEKIAHFMDLLTPGSHGGLPALSLTTKPLCLIAVAKILESVMLEYVNDEVAAVDS